MHRLLHRLVDHLRLQVQQRADAGRLRRAEMGDVVDPVLVQRDRAHEVDVDLVAGGDAADQVAAGFPHGLRHREDRRDVVAGMRVVLRQERVVHVELAHRGAVRPGGVFRTDGLARRHAEHRCTGGAARTRMTQRHVARRHRRMAIDRSDRHRGVVDDAVDDHLGHVLLHRHLVGGERGDLPGKLVLALQVVLRGMHPHVVQDHAFLRWVGWRRYPILRRVGVAHRQAHWTARVVCAHAYI